MSKARAKGLTHWTCSKCDRHLAVEEFYEDTRPQSVSGVKQPCKECVCRLGAKRRLEQEKLYTPPPRVDGEELRPGFGVATHQVGLIGEAEFISFACRRGWLLFRGLAGHEPYDYIVDTGTDRLRVEVKATLSAKRRSTATAGEIDYVIVTKLDADPSRFDYLFAHTPKGNYWIPVDQCPKSSFSTTVHPKGAADKWEAYRV